MLNLTFKIIFLVFTIYSLIHSISYGINEIKNEKNKYGGLSVILLTIFGTIFSNIIIWIR